MLRGNLATRPFYNDRAVRLGLAAAALGIAALTAYNAMQVVALNARNGELTARVDQAERQTAQYREQARGITQAMNQDEVTAVQDAAREANLLIDQRVFSWTDLFNRFEDTLPADVRISAVEPQLDRDGRMLIVISVVSRQVEDLHTFMDQLEATGGLRDVISRQDDVTDDGMLRSVIQGYYEPQAADAETDAGTPPSASETKNAPGNAPPRAPVPSDSKEGSR